MKELIIKQWDDKENTYKEVFRQKSKVMDITINDFHDFTIISLS